MRVNISVSDPWDLGEAISWAPLRGTVEDWHERRGTARALIHLAEPLQYKGADVEYLVASARHEGTSVTDLRRRERVLCSLTAVDEEAKRQGISLAMDAWRGGLVIIGEVAPDHAV